MRIRHSTRINSCTVYGTTFSLNMDSSNIETGVRRNDRGMGHLYRVIILMTILFAISIVVIIVYVAKNNNNQHGGRLIIPIRPELFTPPTMLAK